MPGKTTKRSRKIIESSIVAPVTPVVPPRPSPIRFKVILGFVVLVVVAALVWSKNKGWLLAASINGQPVTRAELNERLTQRFGSQMLEAMVGEKLIMNEAAKQGSVANDDEVKQKIAEVEKSLSGTMSLDDSLKMQGITRDEFENQVRIQLVIEKMLSSEVSVSAEEVTDYLKNNANTMTATTDAERKTEAENQIKGNKMAQKFSEWFAKLKDSAKIEKYL